MLAAAATRGGLIFAMATGSVMMWIGAPLMWVFIASQVSDATGVSPPAIACIVIGIPTTMFVIAKILALVESLYEKVTGDPKANRPVHQAWMRSMRDDRDAHRRRTMLDVVMTTSVGIASLVFAVWFAFFAEGGGI
ncbi:MAG: hypothetical protein JHC95_05155 [Solirubrobacteraceae bacterium]|nr:hypothetical protein [Solirubrobacteraceae bacterium]